MNSETYSALKSSLITLNTKKVTIFDEEEKKTQRRVIEIMKKSGLGVDNKQKVDKRLTQIEIKKFGIPPEYLYAVSRQRSTRALVQTCKGKKNKKNAPWFCCGYQPDNHNHDSRTNDPNFWDNMVIEEEIKSIRLWNCWIMILRLVSSLMYVFFAAFRSNTSDFSIFYTISHVVEPFFLVDLILNFFKAYTPNHTTVQVCEF
jgi:hypothetical protein